MEEKWENKKSRREKAAAKDLFSTTLYIFVFYYIHYSDMHTDITATHVKVTLTVYVQTDALSKPVDSHDEYAFTVTEHTELRWPHMVY